MFHHRLLVRYVLVLGGAIEGCVCTGTAVSPSPVSTGMWGGDHISLTVADTTSHVEFDCAHGDILPSSIDRGLIPAR
jgi:hypothetical protein